MTADTFSSNTVLLGGGRFQLSRAEHDGRPVLLKTIATEFADADAHDRLHREYELEERISHPNVAKAIDFLVAGPRPVLVLADEGGTTLRSLLATGPLSVRRSIEIGACIAAGLAELHRQDIVHRDMSPSSIMVDDNGGVRIVDLSEATVVPRQQAALITPSVMQGNLAYISPEQTGRMHRAVDFRTDLYSLGITLYEMITGDLPLKSNDPLQLVHDHLVKRPDHVCTRRQDVPRIVGDLIARLLEKDPANRYRSAAGVESDLNRILDALVRGLDPDALELKGVEVSTRFQFPEQLFGRDSELAQLRESFDRAVSGRTTLVLVHGYSGVGKSSLIEELRSEVVLRRGFIAAGKFDQMDRGSAWGAVIAAFTDLVRQLLTEDDDSVRRWRTELRETLGDGAGVLAEVVPNLAALVGGTTQPERLDAASERNRFNRLVSLFLAAVTSPERPLVILLDDLQWADPATVDFIERLMLDEFQDALLVIGAYRDNEIDESHSVHRLRTRLAANSVEFGDIALEPLADAPMSQLVAASLGRSEEDAAPLTRLCIRRTGSNPFFVRLFLTSLFEDGLLEVDPSTGAWSWDMEKVASRQLTENMVELAMERIGATSEAAQSLLSLMSIVGIEGDTTLLLEATGADPREALYELAAQELVTLTEGDGGGTWRFSHDRIQEAASARTGPAERLEHHERVGRVLRSRFGAGDTETSIFSVLRHLNEVARQENTVDAELARMNLEGGRAAMRATAYDAALRYFSDGVAQLGSDRWSRHNEIAFALHLGAAAAARLATRFEDLEIWLRNIFDSTDVLSQRIEATQVELLFLADNMGDNHGAVDVARAAFRELGWQLPDRPRLPTVMSQLLLTRWMLRRYSSADLEGLPPMEDEKARLTMRLLKDSVASAYWADPNLMALMIFKAVQLSVRHGMDAASPVFFASYGMVLSAIVGQCETGRRYADLAVEIAERMGAEALPSRARFIRDSLVAPATTPLKDIDPSLERAWVDGREIGDMGFATGAFFFRGLHRLLYGIPLETLEEEVEAAVALLRRHAQVRNLGAAMALRQFVHEMRHGTEAGVPFAGPHIDADAHLQNADRMTRCWTHTFRAMSRYHFGDAEGAMADIVAGETYLDSALGQALVPMHHLYGVLAASSLARTGRRAALRAARRHRRKLVWFAKKNPVELDAAMKLADGAVAAAEKRGEALGLLDAAAEQASRRAIPLVAALAASVGAHVATSDALGDEASKRQTDAYGAYRSWGAASLAERLSSGAEAQRTRESDLDLETVVRASEAISEHIELESLLTGLMGVTLQNAGAERGVLFRVQDGVVVPEAEGTLARGSNDVSVVVLRHDSRPHVANTVLRLVARTEEPLISDCALHDPSFSNDPDIRERSVRSLMCLPLSSQGQINGILYLENNQVDGAFTPERYRLLRVLSGQAASALEKARLHEAQRRLIAAQLKFVPAKFLYTLGHDSLFDVELGEGLTREADILFTDIRGFTTIVENMSPNEAMEFLNDYLAHMEPVVHEYGGFIDRYDGDAILALFDAADEDAAVRAAIAMAEAERADNERRAARGLPPVHTGFGINTDEVMLGVVGGETSMRASLIGDAVNLAARVESLTKRYKTRMLIAENTARRMRPETRATLRPLERLQVAGKSKITLVYEVLEAMDPDERERRLRSFETYLEAHAAYEAGDLAAAKRGFGAVIAADEDDNACRIMLECVERLMHSEETLSLPPVTRLEKK